MSIYITKNGQKEKLNIPASDVQILDIDGKFKSGNLEDALKEVGSGTETNMLRVEEQISTFSSDMQSNKELVSINHNLNGYPTTKLTYVEFGAGVGGAGDHIAGGDSEYNTLIQNKTVYQDENNMTIYVPANYHLKTPSIEKLSNYRYIVTFANSTKSILIDLADSNVGEEIETLSNGLSEVTTRLSDIATISVKSFGAKGDGITDDTTSIQSALDFSTTGLRYVKIPDGDFMVNPYIKLKLRSNTKLEFSKNARLISINTNHDISSVLDVRNVENIEIINPVIIGDRDANTAITEGAGHGITVIGVKNLKITGGNISKCFTDGIYVNAVENALVEFVTCDNNRRQGMSVTCARNFLCRNSTFKNTNGTAPMMGVDIEPNYATDYLENVTLENIYTENNSASGIGINYNQLDNVDTVIDVTIRNWKDKGSKNAFTCTKYTGLVSEASTIKVENLKSVDAKESAIMMIGHKADGTAKISLIRPIVHNCNTTNGTHERMQNVAISIHTETTGYPSVTVQGNCEIIEPRITMATGRTILRGIYVGFGNTIKNIIIKDPLKIDIGDMTNLSVNNNHNLISFNQAVVSNVIVSDKYGALACSITSMSGLIRNYNTSLYSKVILNTTAITQIKESIRWDIAEELWIINNLSTNLSVVIASGYTFIDETNAIITGTYSTTTIGAVLHFKKIKDGMFKIVKEYGTWTLS